MAISSAFKSAATQKVAQENQFVGGIGSAVTSTAAATFALGNAKAATNLAGRISGIGGNAMASVMNEKVETAKLNAEKKTLFTSDEIKATITSNLGDNPINRAAKKTLAPVFETLAKAKETKMIDDKGMLDTSFGKVDPNSELGKQIVGKLGGKNDDNDR